MEDEVYLEDGQCYIPRKGKVKQFMYQWRNGRKYGYPICCIFRFSLEVALDDGKIKDLKKMYDNHRGQVTLKDGTQCVPCNVFHHKTESDETSSQEKLPV